MPLSMTQCHNFKLGTEASVFRRINEKNLFIAISTRHHSSTQHHDKQPNTIQHRVSAQTKCTTISKPFKIWQDCTLKAIILKSHSGFRITI